VLSDIDLFLAQTDEDAARLKQIGARHERVAVIGNMKFDILLSGDSPIVSQLRKAIPPNAPTIVCGSTTEGEEELVLASFRQLLQRFPEAVMILAPRHPERFEKVAGLIGSAGFNLTRRSQWNSAPAIPAGSIFLLDTVGELAAVYALADVAFVGGSLLPLGGHNILEPAQHGVAVLTGPNTFNFREIVRIFAQGGGLRIVTADNFGNVLVELFQDPEQRNRLGQRARELFLANTGATGRTLAALQPLLSGKTSVTR
jgi:3-deoxy-D-manno-octulosonic-acid transferase